MQKVVDGLLVNFEYFENNKSKEHVIILHGWGGCLSEWLETARILKKTFNVLLLDLPGFGATSKSEKDFDTYDYAKFVKDFLSNLKIKKCIVIGHSFGGRLGIILSATTNIVSQLVLVDSAGIERKSFRVRFIKLLSKFFKYLLPKRFNTYLQLKFGSKDYVKANGLRNTFVKVVSQDLRWHFENIVIPTLIIWGNEDTELSINHARELHKKIRNSKLRIVWGADHHPHIEKPSQFHQILVEYLC